MNQRELNRIARQAGFSVMRSTKDDYFDARRKGWDTIHYDETALVEKDAFLVGLRHFLEGLVTKGKHKAIRNIVFFKHAGWTVINDCNVPCNTVYAQVK